MRLEQALGNMVDNALRHGAGDVRLSAVAAPTTVDLRVADDGPGFASGFIDQAFERFSRADGARSRGGTGCAEVSIELPAHLQGPDGAPRYEIDDQLSR